VRREIQNVPVLSPHKKTTRQPELRARQPKAENRAAIKAMSETDKGLKTNGWVKKNVKAR
jgi:hypothetical protein